MKRIIALIIALGMPLFFLTACGNSTGEALTLYEGNAVKIEREGQITRIYDLAGNAEYTLKTHRTKKEKEKADSVKEAQTAASTETINIKTAHGIIIVTTADGKTFYIK